MSIGGRRQNGRVMQDNGVPVPGKSIFLCVVFEYKRRSLFI